LADLLKETQRQANEAYPQFKKDPFSVLTSPNAGLRPQPNSYKGSGFWALGIARYLKPNTQCH